MSLRLALLASAMTIGFAVSWPTPTWSSPFELARTVLNPRERAGDRFGHSVAFAGSNIVAGAPEDGVGPGTGGAAFLLSGADGSLIHAFENPSPGLEDFFGFSVSGIGDRVIVGAPLDKITDFGPRGFGPVGAAYLFDAGSGELGTTLDGPGFVNSFFGQAVLSVGDNILVGAPGDVGRGAAYLFDGSTGALLKKFENPNPDVEQEFGISLAKVGSNIVIGARGRGSTQDPNGGMVYVFNGDPGSSSFGDLLVTLDNPTPSPGDFYGHTVTTIGSTVIVGAPGDDTAGKDAGAVYLFDGDPGSATFGSLINTVLNPTPADNDTFGFSVASAGSMFLVGAPADDTAAGDAGAAYLFDGDRTSANFATLLQTILNPTPEVSDIFGWAVAGTNNALMIGAPLDDTAMEDAGAVYLYRDVSSAAIPEPATLAIFAIGLAAFGGTLRRSRRREECLSDPSRFVPTGPTGGALMTA